MAAPGSSRPPLPVEITVCPGGPLLVRGATEVVADDGERVAVTRPVVAVCRCGRSSRAPWCDGSHKLGPRLPHLPG